MKFNSGYEPHRQKQMQEQRKALEEKRTKLAGTSRRKRKTVSAPAEAVPAAADAQTQIKSNIKFSAMPAGGNSSSTAGTGFR